MLMCAVTVFFHSLAVPKDLGLLYTLCAICPAPNLDQSVSFGFVWHFRQGKACCSPSGIYWICERQRAACLGPLEGSQG